MLGEVLTAMVTPFKTDGSVDLESFRSLARYRQLLVEFARAVPGRLAQGPAPLRAVEGGAA